MYNADRKMKFHLLLWAVFALSAFSAVLIHFGGYRNEKPSGEPGSQPSPRQPAAASRTYLV